MSIRHPMKTGLAIRCAAVLLGMGLIGLVACGGGSTPTSRARRRTPTPTP
jgi:hypothetical protein